MKGAWLTLVLAVPLAYAISTFPDYPVKAAREYAVTTEAGGVSAGVEPVEDPQAQQTYFRADLAAKGFVPVFIVIQNGSDRDSFLFDKTKIVYGPAQSTITTPKTGSKGGQALALSAIPFAGLFAGLKLISDASQVQQNLLKKEVQSTTLSPGAPTHGFVYIPVPKKRRGRRFSCTYRSVRLAPTKSSV